MERRFLSLSLILPLILINFLNKLDLLLLLVYHYLYFFSFSESPLVLFLCYFPCMSYRSDLHTPPLPLSLFLGSHGQLPVCSSPMASLTGHHFSAPHANDGPACCCNAQCRTLFTCVLGAAGAKNLRSFMRLCTYIVVHRCTTGLHILLSF